MSDVKSGARLGNVSARATSVDPSRPLYRRIEEKIRLKH